MPNGKSSSHASPSTICFHTRRGLLSGHLFSFPSFGICFSGFQHDEHISPSSTTSTLWCRALIGPQRWSSLSAQYAAPEAPIRSTKSQRGVFLWRSQFHQVLFDCAVGLERDIPLWTRHLLLPLFSVSLPVSVLLFLTLHPAAFSSRLASQIPHELFL